MGSHEELITEMVKAYTSRANPRPFDMRQAMRDVLAIVQNRIVEPIEAELADARRESEALRADAWQPIETAPKDGSLILLRSPKGRIADGFWGHYGVWAWPYVMVEPTEWRPLPISAARAGGGHE